MSSIAIVNEFQSLADKKEEHNCLVNRQASAIQDAALCGWHELWTACQANPDAYLIAILPANDNQIDATSLLNAENIKEDSFLFNIHESSEQHVSINLPVTAFFVTDKFIVLSANSDFTDSDIPHMKEIESAMCLNGSEFINRFRRGNTNPASPCFYELNPPTLYVEYIEDMYFNKYNWTSLHPEFKAVVLFNPKAVGFRRLMLTPHY